MRTTVEDLEKEGIIAVFFKENIGVYGVLLLIMKIFIAKQKINQI